MFLVEATAKKRMGRLGELQVRTGQLRGSIQSGVKNGPSGTVGWVGSNLIYARIHELGGIIKPRAKKYLRFPINGHWVTVSKVKMPARPYLEPSIKENTEKIKEIVQENILRELNR